MMACGSRRTDERGWLRARIIHYIDDEYGHEQWILDDMRACGADPQRVTSGRPSRATIDPNYFYVDYLYGQKEYAVAREALLKAQQAPDRPDRELADEGRRRGVAELLTQVDRKLGIAAAGV